MTPHRHVPRLSQTVSCFIKSTGGSLSKLQNWRVVSEAQILNVFSGPLSQKAKGLGGAQQLSTLRGKPNYISRHEPRTQRRSEV